MKQEQISMLCELGANWDEAMDRMAGNSDFYVHLVGMYSQNNHMTSLKKALSENDVDEAFAHAHNLKGVSGNLSFSEFFNASIAVTEALREKDIEAAKQLLPALEETEQKARTAAMLAASWDN